MLVLRTKPCKGRIVKLNLANPWIAHYKRVKVRNTRIEETDNHTNEWLIRAKRSSNRLALIGTIELWSNISWKNNKKSSAEPARAAPSSITLSPIRSSQV